MTQRICVFTGSSPGARSDYANAAGELGRELTQRGLELVYGGANVGLMGSLADAVLESGGRVTGVLPEALVAKELAHPDLSELRVVASMHERKALMAELSDAFIALPGGLGTLEEFVEVLTWAQLGLHAKPCGLFNVAGYFDPLLSLFDHALEGRFLRPEHRAMVITAKSPAALLDQLSNYEPAVVGKWIDRDES